MIRSYRFILAALIAALSPLFLVSPSSAAELVVNTTSDGIIDNDGRCTLREAIAAANADMPLHDCATGDGADVILLPSNDFVLNLAGANEDGNLTGDFDITDDLTIRPQDADALVRIDGADLDRIFDVKNGADLTLERLELRGGNVVGFGGAIITFETTSLLSVRHCVISNNESTLFGGAITASGPTEIVESFVINNRSTLGGGIYLFNDNKLVLVRSQISNNTASADGGGIFGASITALESSISNNTAERDGAGLYLGENGDPTTNLIFNTTIAYNEASRDGGGIFADFSGTLDLFNVTVAYNTADSDEDDAGDGGGLFVVAGIVRPRHSIFGANIDDSTGGVSAPDCAGAVESAGRNLFSAIDFGVCQTSGDTATDMVGPLGSPLGPDLDSCLEPVADSITSALSPLDGSPAVDAGDPAGCLGPGGTELEGDQAGNRRVWDGPDPDAIARCDLGAIELGAPSLSFIFGDTFESGDVSEWTLVVPPQSLLDSTPSRIFRPLDLPRRGCPKLGP